MKEQRRAARLATSYQVLFERATQDCAGTVVVISRTGALIEAARDRAPAVGEHVRLHIAATDPAIELDARVVSVADRGFAVAFSNLNADLLELLDDLGA